MSLSIFVRYFSALCIRFDPQQTFAQIACFFFTLTSGVQFQSSFAQSKKLIRYKLLPILQFNLYTIDNRHGMITSTITLHNNN